MKPERQILIHDLMDDGQGESRRAAALNCGGRILRRKRWCRTATRAFGMALCLTAAALLLHLRIAPRPPILSATPPQPAAVKYLTDDQLLALFPNTPVGLATVGERKVLVFPRPGDQKRFVGKF